jgi:hypothetical protein
MSIMDASLLPRPDGCVRNHFDRPIPIPPHLAGREGMVFVQLFIRAAQDQCLPCTNMLARGMDQFPEVYEPILDYAAAVGNMLRTEGVLEGPPAVPRPEALRNLTEEQQQLTFESLLGVCCAGAAFVEDGRLLDEGTPATPRRLPPKAPHRSRPKRRKPRRR